MVSKFSSTFLNKKITIFLFGNAYSDLKKSITSISNQTYKNVKVIFVLKQKDKIVPKIDNLCSLLKIQHNYCFFEDRKISSILSTDICKNFIDDYVFLMQAGDVLSIDLLRLLLLSSIKNQFEINICDVAFFRKKGVFYHNLDLSRTRRLDLNNEGGYRYFITSGFSHHSVWAPWNKLYEKTLFLKILDEDNSYISKINLNAFPLFFSFIAFRLANKIGNIHNNAFYIYSASEFWFFNNSYFKDDYNELGQILSNFILKSINADPSLSNKDSTYKDWLGLLSLLLKNEKFIQDNEQNTDYYLSLYSVVSSLSKEYFEEEEIKAKIISPKVKVISFDIFDTLIDRLLFYPTDLFDYLSTYILTFNSSYVDFKKMRCSGEYNCRVKCYIDGKNEDITIDDIYEEIGHLSNFSKDVLNQIKAKEIELELLFCKQKEFGKELYDLARQYNKYIILISDMYLNKHIVETILSKNEYLNYKKLYLSSDVKLLKRTGNLFKYVIKDLHRSDFTTNEMLHIGDSYHNDVVIPKSLGLDAIQLISSSDLLWHNSPVYQGDAFRNSFFRKMNWVNYYNLFARFYPDRSVFALVAKQMFGNPFISFNKSSDFNCDPYLIGYSAVGPYVLAVSNWIIQTARKYNCKKIHFVARDGYIIKKAVDIIKDKNLETNYLRFSRRSVSLGDVNSVDDVYSIDSKFDVYNITPNDLISFLNPILMENSEKKIKSILSTVKKPNMRFTSYEEYYDLLHKIVSSCVNQKSISNHQRLLKSYFSRLIKKGDWIFDIGYSGRGECILSNILGFTVNSMYLHIKDDVALQRQKKHRCLNECFFESEPVVTYYIREHTLMELGPSTIGYVKKGEHVVEKFDTYNQPTVPIIVTQSLHDGIIDFMKDFRNYLSPLLDADLLSNHCLIAPHEYYLHKAKVFDRNIFNFMKFEDNMGKYFSVRKQWDYDISTLLSKQEKAAELIWVTANKILPIGSKRRKVTRKVGKFIYKKILKK